MNIYVCVNVLQFGSYLFWIDTEIPTQNRALFPLVFWQVLNLACGCTVDAKIIDK